MLLGLALLLPVPAARAADPQPYTVSIAPTGQAALDAALAGASQLAALRQKAPVGPVALVSRARQDVTRLETALHSFGYYDGTVHVVIDGRALDDPSLAERLDAVPQATAVAVRISVVPGPLYHLRSIVIDGAVPANARARLGLEPGQPAVAAEVLAAGARLLAALQEDGYALATVNPPIATLDPAAHVLDLSFKAEAGRRATIGKITLAGLKGVHAGFVRRHLLLHPGQLYQPSKIEAARLDLAALSVFSGVSVQAGKVIGPDGAIPITFDFQERPRHAVGLTGAYSTDLGGSVKASWSDRNLFGNAEQLNLSAAGTGLGGTAITGLGYNATAQFIKPDFLRRDQSLEFNLGALQQDLQAYDQQAETAAVALNRTLSRLWSGSIGLSAAQEQIQQEGETVYYMLLGVPLTLKYDSTGRADPLQDPTHGARLAMTATPTGSFGKRNSAFVILQATGSAYFDFAKLGLTRPGRSVLAVRGLIGTVDGATQFALPPDQRFYGGGSATVRGFKYQSIGPRFPDGNPTGGAAIDAGTIEFRQRLFGNFGAAAFVDAGQVSAGNLLFGGILRIGTGLGLRYYTPIGPIRLDVAVPVNRPPGDDSFEFYIGLGQAF